MMPHNRLSEKATKIVINRQQGWEYALLAQVVTDEIENQKVLAPTLLSTIMTESTPIIFKIDTGVSLGNFCAWMEAKINELDDLGRHFPNLLAADNQDAFGLPGQPGNPEKIVQLGIRVGELYSDVLVFENVIRMHSCDTSEFLNEDYPEFKSKLRDIFDDFPGIVTEPLTKLVQFYEQWGPEILRRIHDAVSRVQPGEPLYLDLNFELSLNFNSTNVLERAILLLKEIDIETERRLSEIEHIPLSASENLNAGYLYLLMNPSMPGLIKIGKTTRTADQRLKELGAATGVPTPFALVFEVWVHDCHRAEKYVHDLLSENRVAGNREFFNVASTVAIKIMMDAEVYVSPKFLIKEGS